MKKKTKISLFDHEDEISNGSISHRKVPRRPQSVGGNTNIALKKKKAPRAKITMKSEVSNGNVILHLPLETVSEANSFEHWRKKHERHTLQKKIVTNALMPWKKYLKLPCLIKFTRIAPRKLDRWDNLPMSVKYILDSCCAVITGDFRAGRADDDERISVSYDQISSPKYGLIIEFICQ